MFETILQFPSQLKTVVSSIFLALALLTGSHQNINIQNVNVDQVMQAEAPQSPGPILGTNFSACADFRTQLSASLSPSATSMTVDSLACGTETLDAGQTYGFKLGGREYVIGTVSTTTAKTITMLTRGLSRKTATTSVASFAVQWGRGTSIEQTDAPILIDHSNKITAKEGFDVPIRYVASVSTSTLVANQQNLATVNYVNSVAFSGAAVVDGSTATKGVVELASQLETASSTAVGNSGNLVIAASSATSTYNSATAPLRVVTTQNNGKIDVNFFPSTLVSTSSLAQFATSSINIGAFPAYNIGKNFALITAIGTSSWQTPSGITKVFVQLVGGGGPGARAVCATANSNSGAGGGSAGGYSQEFVDITGTSSIQVFVGKGGTYTGSAANWTTFGTNGFYLYATPGASSTDVTSAQSSGGATPGNGFGGDVNIPGEAGGYGLNEGTVSGNQALGGKGGDSLLGKGGSNVSSNGSSGVVGTNGGGYGSGGGGAACVASDARNGGDGAQGAILIYW